MYIYIEPWKQNQGTCYCLLLNIFETVLSFEVFIFRTEIVQNLSNFLSFPSAQLLLRKKAAEELKKEQERKAAERRKVIDERCGQPKDLDSASEGEQNKSHIYLLYT